MPKKYLSQEQLEYIANHLSEIASESEDEDLSDMDSLLDPEYLPPVCDEDQEESDNEIDQDDEDQEVSNNQIDQADDDDQLNEESVGKSRNSKDKIKVIWKKKNLILNEAQLTFHGDESLSHELLQLITPYDCFTYFFTKKLFDKIVEESNLYAQQTDITKPLHLDADEAKQYIGILIMMSIIRLPNTRFYWKDDIGIEIIKNTLPLNRFEKIRQFWHLNDNNRILPREHVNHDRLHKLRPLIDVLNENFSKIPLEACLSVDEQLCSTKIGHFMKQYLPMKPHKWGFKLFVICGVSGFGYKFEIYSGQENDHAHRLALEPDMGACANIVARLSRIIPRNINHRLYFDNYYTSMNLLVFLAENGILSLGTVRRNRIVNCKLPNEKNMKSDTRGTSYEYVAIYKNIEISSLVWKDNRAVTLLSTFGGQIPITTINRYDKTSKSKKEISCPYIIKEYNKHMGGVDLLDANIARHKIQIKSKKWYMRIFYHLLDLTLVNAWLLYRRIRAAKPGNMKDMEDMTLFNFRKEVAICLCQMGQRSSSLKRGRPSLIHVERMLAAKKKNRTTQHVPPRNVRLDEVGHWLIWTNRNRCKFPKCKGYSQTACEKCGLNLCCNKNNNCFKNFHTEL